MQTLRDNFIGEGKGMLTFQSGKPDGEELVDHFFGKNNTPKMNFRHLRMVMEKKNLDIFSSAPAIAAIPMRSVYARTFRKCPSWSTRASFSMRKRKYPRRSFLQPSARKIRWLGVKNRKGSRLLRARLTVLPRHHPERYPDFKEPEDTCRILQKRVPS